MNVEIHDIELVLNGKIILRDFSLSFNGPGLIMIEGENGSGKSSALKVIAGFTIPKKGKVLLAGKDPSLLKSGDMSFLTTTSLGLMGDLTGREHVQIINHMLKIDRSVLDSALIEFMELKIFKEIMSSKVSDMSQGMRQILRFFIHIYFKPGYLFLDEPFLYLSPTVKDFFMKKVEAMARDSLIFITDQKFDWLPGGHYCRISLGNK